MKKIISIACFFLMATATSVAQDGVAFQPVAGWQEVLAKAKQENKYVFVDCYATWCGPCKAMDKNIFPDKEVGKFINEKFISVKVQMDKTKNDVPVIQSWYRDAAMLKSNYAISAFPTYLVFSPDGEPLHRFTGASKTGAEFIDKTKNALNASTQYYKTVHQYKEHKNDSAFLRNAIKVALSSSDRKMAAEIGNYYIDVVNPMAKDNLITLRLTTLTSKDKSFKFFLENAKAVNAVMGAKYAETIVGAVLYEDDLKPYFEAGKTTSDWRKLTVMLKKKYHILNPKTIDRYEAAYYLRKNDTARFEKAMLSYVEKYESQFNEDELNDHAWTAVSICENKDILEMALKWSEKSLELVDKSPSSNYCNFMDTYANIFYKLGRKEDAINWEKKALEIATRDKKEKIAKAIAVNMEKMEKGEKTW
jgi:thiol-disulfide isomerase/thioredoxin